MKEKVVLIGGGIVAVIVLAILSKKSTKKWYCAECIDVNGTNPKSSSYCSNRKGIKAYMTYMKSWSPKNDTKWKCEKRKSEKPSDAPDDIFNY